MIEVPCAGRMDKSVYINGNPRNSYRMYGDSDHRCGTDAIASIMSDFRPGVTDGWTVEVCQTEDLYRKTLSTFRNSLLSRKPDHVWLQLPDGDFLRVIGATRTDGDVLKSMAANLIIFGYEYHISSVLGNYCLDYRKYDTGGED